MQIINKVKKLFYKHSEVSDKSRKDKIKNDKEVNRFNQSPLHFFAFHNETEKLENCILKAVDLNLIDSLGKTTLHYCAMNNNFETVCLLLANNARTDITDIFGDLALKDAVLSSNGDLRSVEQLLLCASDMHLKNIKNQNVLELVEKINDKEVLVLFDKYNFC
ncbi:MAG: ankyrin repeat domain-containing protein [Saccharospirillaceae bacterium]|nr:ankyrin repeat domain-containing protein [Pseudomonadales bacterium]NRB77928.1 ankyrin repeat domain-containing protein [Saccharospirillaceae bacterium]